MRQRAVEESLPQSEQGREALRCGWCLGGESFRERMLRLLEQTSEKLSRGKQLDGVVRQSHNYDEAERLLHAGLLHFTLQPAQLGELKKNDLRKIALARLIRNRTTVTNEWIARALAMGHACAVSRSLRAGGEAAAEEAALTSALAREDK
jgi:hypothetical protein